MPQPYKKLSEHMSEFAPPEPSGSPEGQVGVRLNKVLADAGVCSRRKADALILSGAVRVNGTATRELGRRVKISGKDADHIAVNGTPIAGPCEHIWLLLHKPVQVVSTAHDPEGRVTVLDILPSTWKDRRLFPLGRLDYFSEGLLFLTNDGELAHAVLHPRRCVPKVYQVLLKEKPSNEALCSMRDGMRLADGSRLAPVRAQILPFSRALPHFPKCGALLEMTLVQGVNRQIRRMCRDLGLTVLRLARVSQAGIRLGDLPPGATRLLTHEELLLLRSYAESASETPPSRQKS